jgi:hypothetical protein
MKQTYTLADLTVWPLNNQIKEDKVVAHLHTVHFSRALNPTEQQKFSRLLISFYDVVHYSHQFGDGFLAEPTIIFDAPDQATYTLHQGGTAGPWKDLLFAMLMTFSYEVVAIVSHDNSHAFAPQPLAM